MVDSASDDREQQIEAVNKVLAEIGAADVPQVLVWNKIDLRGSEPGVECDEYGKIFRVRLSARTGAGLDLLRGVLIEVAKKAAERPVAPDPFREIEPPIESPMHYLNDK